MSVDGIGPPIHDKNLLLHFDELRRGVQQKLEGIESFIKGHRQEINEETIRQLSNAISDISKNPFFKDMPVVKRIVLYIQENAPTKPSKTVEMVVQPDASQAMMIKKHALEPLTKEKELQEKLNDIKEKISLWTNEKDSDQKKAAGKLIYSIFREKAVKDPYYRLAIAQSHFLGVGVSPNDETGFIKLMEIQDDYKDDHLNTLVSDLIEEILRKGA